MSSKVFRPYRRVEHRRRIDHVGVVEHRNVDRPVVLSALRERRVGEEADRRFFGVLVEVHAAQRHLVVEMVVDFSAHLLSQIVRRALGDIVRTAVVDVGIAGVRQRQVLHDVGADGVDAVGWNPVAGKRLPRARHRIGGERIVNDDRTPTRIEERREIAEPFGGGRHVQVAVLCQSVTVAFGGRPEEGPASDDRAADAAAGVAPELVGVRPALQLEEEVLAYQRARTHEQKPGALDPVRPGFRASR